MTSATEPRQLAPRAPGALGRGVRLERLVASGPFCEVWQATAEGPATPAGTALPAAVAACVTGPRAVKIATHPVGERMLATEAAVAADLEGVGGVVRILASSRDPWPHVVMPWCDGGTLRSVLRAVHDPDARARALAQAIDVVATVAAVHRRGVIHGDLKPENVLLDGRGRPFVADFGLARERQRLRLDAKLDASLGSKDELCGGTVAYLAPELVKGGEPSLAGDVYALGVMLHEAALGARPGKALGADELQALLPEPLWEVLRRALAFAPEDRFPDAGALDHALGPVAPALTATGARRRLRQLGRVTRAGLAAFFVCFRYASVAALLAAYAALAYASVVQPTIALAWIAVFAFHAFVRWEGPETWTEADARRRGLVVSPPPPSPPPPSAPAPSASPASTAPVSAPAPDRRQRGRGGRRGVGST